MTNKRKTLQKIAGIGAIFSAMPITWTTPVVKSLVLPAHAQTSFGLSLNQIDDVLFTGFYADDPRVNTYGDNLAGKVVNRMSLISGRNISSNAVLSVTNDPTTTPNDLGEIVVSGLVVTWVFYVLSENVPDLVVDKPPIGDYVLNLKVTNPDGESKIASVKCTFLVPTPCTINCS